MLTVNPGCADRTCSYNPRADCRTGTSTAMPRSARNASTTASFSVASRRNQPMTRASISRAALRVKVIARISPGATPASSRRTMREASNQVLPLPAQASTTTLRAGSRAALPSHASVFMVITHKNGPPNYFLPPCSSSIRLNRNHVKTSQASRKARTFAGNHLVLPEAMRYSPRSQKSGIHAVNPPAVQHIFFNDPTRIFQ